MMAFFPHLILISIVGAASLLFLQKGASRRDLLAMGFATSFSTLWMISVVMTDFEVQNGTLPVFWLSMSFTALLPTLFFVYLSILALEQYYNPAQPLPLRSWLPLAVAIITLLVVQYFVPNLFFHGAELVYPRTDKLDLRPMINLRFTLGIGYYIFLALGAYVVYEIAIRFPRIIDSMQLPEAERRTRLLLSLGTLAGFWGVALDLLPALASTVAPSFLRLVGPTLGVAGALYAVVLARALDPKAVIRSAIFYSIRIAVIALPIAYLFAPYRYWFAELEPGAASAATLAGILVIDFLAQRLKPLLDSIAMRRTYNSIEAVNNLIHELLYLRDMRDFSGTVSGFIAKTLGANDVRVWVPQLNDRLKLHDMENNDLLQMPVETAQALVDRNQATAEEDVQLDPRVFQSREFLGKLFEDLNAEVILPLVDEHKLVGMITLGIKNSFDEYYEQDLEFLDRIRAATALSLTNTQLYELARSGKPIKVLSREEFEHNLAQQWAKARRYNESISMALFRMADPAGFDREHGEGAAAIYLKALGEMMRPTLRARDLPAFFDEHTLAIFMPQTPLPGAEIAGRRLRIWLETAQVVVLDKALNSRIIMGLTTRDDNMHEPGPFLQSAIDALSDSTAVMAD